GVIGQRAGDLARLVDRLLLASLSGEPSRRRGSPVPVPFDLVAALKWAAGELTPELALTADLPTALPAALGEPGAVATVLTELATNAHKYSPDGGEVLLTAGADAQTVWFRVADRGLGVRPGHVERAFERSWQAQGGERRRFGGVGLGLYLVRRIVERQNGWVSLRPRERGGTVAEVRLPRADPAPEEDRRAHGGWRTTLGGGRPAACPRGQPGPAPARRRPVPRPGGRSPPPRRRPPRR